MFFVKAIVVLAALALSQSAEPLAADTSGATTRPVDVVRQMVQDLAHADPAVRGRARFDLLHLSPQDLPTLQRLVREGLANHPSQRDSLYEIVVHLYLSGEAPPAVDRNESFLGISLPHADAEGHGMIFRDRIPGFPAYASLQPGDILMRIEEKPSVDIADQTALSTLRRMIPPGTTIHVQVLREGKVVVVPLTLAATPDWRNEMVQSVMQRRLERAQAFWDSVFEPLFPAGAS